MLYPATLSNVMAVGAINRYGRITDYSPEGPEIDIVSPSGNITDTCTGDVVTLDIFGTGGCDDGPGGSVDYTSTFSGTSAAAPQVAAAAALVLSREPSLTEAQGRYRLQSKAISWGKSTQIGSGKLDIYRAVANLTVAMSGPARITAEGGYSWTATASGGTGSYVYAWYRNDGYAWDQVGTGTSYSSYVYSSDPSFQLRVTVLSGGLTASSTRSVIVSMAGPV